jgi:hypothetical protein
LGGHPRDRFVVIGVVLPTPLLSRLGISCDWKTARTLLARRRRTGARTLKTLLAPAWQRPAQRG